MWRGVTLVGGRSGLAGMLNTMWDEHSGCFVPFPDQEWLAAALLRGAGPQVVM